jgi:uncharacterized repeat protein (TIGR01451 family)
LGTIAGGAKATIQIVLTANWPGTITLNSSVSMDQTDPTPADNSTQTQIKVNSPADLGLTASADTNPIVVGEQDNVTDTITNPGDMSAANVQFSDPVVGFTINSVRPSQGSCTHTNTTVSCSLGTIAGGARATIQILVTATLPGIIALNSSVSMAQTDPTPADNSARVTIRVNRLTKPLADLAVTLTPSIDSLLLGHTFTYTIIVSNYGPSVAHNVSLTDHLPSKVKLLSVKPHGGLRCSGTGTISCQQSTLGPSNAEKIFIRVTAAKVGAVLDGVHVTDSSPPDPNLRNNRDHARVDVIGGKPTVSIRPLGPACHLERSVIKVRATADAPAGIRTLRIRFAGLVPVGEGSKEYRSGKHTPVHKTLVAHLSGSRLLEGRTYGVVATVVDVAGRSATAHSHFTMCTASNNRGFTG